MSITIQEIIERLKKELEEAKAELDEVHDAAAKPPEAALGGGTSGYSTWQTQVVYEKHIEQRIEDIENALERAEAGEYGTCDECGEPIPPERLEALPFTTVCVKCAAG